MRVIAKRLSRKLYLSAISSSSPSSIRCHTTPISRTLNTLTKSQPFIHSADDSSGRILAFPWSATQFRGAKYKGADVRPGNVIERKGKVYQVVKAHHTTQGRGGAIIQVELRDVDSGNKVNERLRTDEMVEKVYVEEKSFTYLYTDEESETVVLMEPNTYVQLDVAKHLFGNSLPYLKDDITVTVELFDERPMSASVPKRVSCTVAEAQVPMKGMGATPHTKKALLDNGISVQVPPHIVTGDKILVNTTDNSYISRA